MTELALNLDTRKMTGKEYARKIRREDKVPGVFYFHGEESLPVSMDKKELTFVLNQESSLITVTFDGKKKRKCIVREVQYNPINNKPIHIDLLGIEMSEKIKVQVPIILEGTPDGVKNQGGILEHLLREVEIECLPTDIPDNIKVDVTELSIGDNVRVADLSLENIKILDDVEKPIANVSAPRVIEDEAEIEGEEPTEPEVVGKPSEDE